MREMFPSRRPAGERNRARISVELNCLEFSLQVVNHGNCWQPLQLRERHYPESRWCVPNHSQSIDPS